MKFAYVCCARVCLRAGRASSRKGQCCVKVCAVLRPVCCVKEGSLNVMSQCFCTNVIRDLDMGQTNVT